MQKDITGVSNIVTYG